MALREAAERLAAAGVGDPRAEAQRLLAWVLHTDRGGVLVRRREPLPAAQGAAFSSLVERRCSREPAAYVTGTELFCGLELAVDRRVLVPRPETEDLVAAVLALPPAQGARVVDLGTGSGCIAIALGHARPDLRLMALDRSAPALEVARENADRHGVSLELARGDFADPPRHWRADVVVSNPPYVAEAEWAALEPEVRDHEPRAALVPGPTGLEAYAQLVPAARRLLAGGGFLALELGWHSAGPVVDLVRAAGFVRTRVLPDLAGIARVLIAHRPPP